MKWIYKFYAGLKRITNALKTQLPIFLKKYKLPLISGLLIGTSYIPFPPWASLFCFVPLWWFIFHEKQLKSILIGAFLCQFVTLMLGFNWVAYTIHTYGGMSWSVSVLGLILFCSLANIYIVVASGLWFFLVKKFKLSVPFRLALFFILFSLLHHSFIFPWNMGYVWFTSRLPAFQTAEIWGFHFLGTLIYLFNLCFLVLYKHRWDYVGKRVLAFVIGLFLFLNIYGLYLEKRLDAKMDKELNVILVQHNVGRLSDLLKVKKSISPYRESYYRLKELTYKGVIKYRRKYKKRENVNFVLWPEGAYPYSVSDDAEKVGRISRLIKKTKIPLISGVMVESDEGYSNSLIVFDREGNIQKPIYKKIKLLAFGEYLPGWEWFPFIERFFPYFNGIFMSPGKETVVQNLEGVRLGLQICYESLFSDMTRELANKQADVLINVTNDSWFGSGQEAWQHLFMNLARAVEVRRPLIRGTSTGISSVVKADGHVMKKSPINKPWVYFYKIPYSGQPITTVFMEWGYYIHFVFLVLFLLISYAVFELKFVKSIFLNAFKK